MDVGEVETMILAGLSVECGFCAWLWWSGDGSFDWREQTRSWKDASSGVQSDMRLTA